MASILDRLKRIGVGVKSKAQLAQKSNPGMNQFSTRGGSSYQDIKQQEALNRQAGVGLERFQGRLRSGEKIRNINGVSYVVPVDSPEMRQAIPSMPADGMGGYGQGGDIRQAIPPMFAGGMGGYGQGGMFDPPSPPTRPEFVPPTRPDLVDPTRQTDYGNKTQEIIPVSPDQVIEGLLGKLVKQQEGTNSTIPVRRQDFSPTRTPNTAAPQYDPTLSPGVFSPRMPDMARTDLPPLTPDMFGGQLPMPSPTSFNPDAALEAEFPMPGNAFGNLPVGTSINEQGDLVDARTGEVIIPSYQPTVTRY